MSFDIKTVKSWYGPQIMVEVNQARDDSLVTIGNLGVQQMKSNIKFKDDTGRTRDSIMWRTHNKKSQMGPNAQPKDEIYAPRSRRSVVIGSAARAGEQYTVSTGKGVGLDAGAITGRWAHVVALEYGTIKTRAYPFVGPVKRQISSKVKQTMIGDVKKVIDKPRGSK